MNKEKVSHKRTMVIRTFTRQGSVRDTNNIEEPISNNHTLTTVSTRVSSSRRSRRDGAIIQRQFVYAKEGFRNLNEKRTKDREIKRPRTITRVGYKASLSVKMQDSGKWVVSGFVREHNHELVPPDQVHYLRFHRQISGPANLVLTAVIEEQNMNGTYCRVRFQR